MRWLSVSRLCFLLLPALLAGIPGGAGAIYDGDILIGQSVSLTGPAARNSRLYSEGARLYFDTVNRAGGIFGRPLRLIRLDDAGRPPLARANTQRLIEGNRVVALFGYSGPATSKAALPLAREAGVPFFAPRSGSLSLLQHADSKILFTVRASHRQELRFLIGHLTSVGLYRISMLHSDDEAGYRDVALVTQLLHESGGRLLAGIPMERKQTFGAEAEEAANAILRHRPDAVLVGGDAQPGAAVIRALRRRQYPGPFYGLSQLGPLAFKEMLGEYGAGVALLQTVPFPWRARSAIAAEYRKTAEAYGEMPSFVGLEGYLAAKVLCEGLRRAGPRLTREKLVLALESINDRNYDVGDFSLNFSSDNHHGSRYLDISTISGAGGFIN